MKEDANFGSIVIPKHTEFENIFILVLARR